MLLKFYLFYPSVGPISAHYKRERKIQEYCRIYTMIYRKTDDYNSMMHAHYSLRMTLDQI